MRTALFALFAVLALGACRPVECLPNGAACDVNGNDDCCNGSGCIDFGICCVQPPGVGPAGTSSACIADADCCPNSNCVGGICTLD